MHISRREALVGFSLFTTTAISTSAAAWDGPLMDLVQGGEDFATASEAYIFGYPLVTMEMTRRVITNVAKPEGTRAPMGQVIKLREYPDAKFRDVTAPNADTLYTTSFFDVGDEPWVLSTPDFKGRYVLLPFLSGWTDVFQVPGKRTTGTDAHWPRRQSPAGCRLSDVSQAVDRVELRREEQIHHALREGSATAGERLLVADHV